MTAALNIHATAVALSGIAVLLRGPSGSGKSDLALRLIDQGAVLVADDRVDLTLRGAGLFASPPPNLAGLIEARGLGLIRSPWRGEVPVGLLVDLTASDRIERLPEPARESVLSVSLPVLRLDPWPASAVVKLRLAVGLTLLDKYPPGN